MLTGLFIGLVAGLIIAAGLAWYFNSKSAPVDTVVEIPAEQEAASVAAPEKPSQASTPPKKPPASAPKPQPPVKPVATKPKPAEPTAKPQDTAARPANPDITADAAPGALKPRVDYTFYGILPGDKPAKPVPLPESKDIWWLQVAALKSPADADKLKAKLLLLGLEVAVQKVDTPDMPLYRVRVGPYKREDDAFGDLDTLAASNYEPRLFKDPTPPAAAAIAKEKP